MFLHFDFLLIIFYHKINLFVDWICFWSFTTMYHVFDRFTTFIKNTRAQASWWLQSKILWYALVRFPATSVVFRPGRICQAKRRVPQPVLGRIHEKCKQETKITPLWRFRVSEIVLSIDSWNLSSSIWYLSVRVLAVYTDTGGVNLY